MRIWTKRIGNISIVGCGIFLFLFQLVLIFSVFLYTKKSVVKGIVENFISEKAGSRITIGRIDYRLSPFLIKADSITFSSTHEQSQIDVFLKSLALYGDIQKMVRKKELSFHKAEVSGANISMKLEPDREEISLEDFQNRLHKISTFKHYISKVAFQDASFTLTSDRSEFELENVNGELSAVGKQNELDVTLANGMLSFTDNDRNFNLLAPIQGKGEITLDPNPFFTADISLDRTDLMFEEDRFTFKDTAFGVRGDLSNERLSLNLPSFTTSLPSLASVTGSAFWSRGRETSFVANPHIHVENLDKTVQFLSSRFIPELSDIKLGGTAAIEGKYTFVQDSKGLSNHIEGKLRLDASKLVYVNSHFSLSNTLDAMLYFEGDPAHPEVSGLLQISKGNLERKRIRVHDLSLSIPVSIQTNSQVNIVGLRGEMKALDYTLGNTKIGFAGIQFEGEGSYDPKKNRLNCDFLEIRVPSLTSLTLTADLSLEPAGEMFFHLKASDLDMTALSSVFSSFLPPNIAQWEPSASFNFETSVTKLSGEKLWTTSTRIDLADFQFHNPPFTIAGESLCPRILLRSTYSSDHDHVPFSLEFYLERGESLWNAHYIDWSDHPLSAKVSGIYEADSFHFPDLTASVSVPTLGQVSIHGSVSPAPPFRANVDATISSQHLQSLYAFLSSDEDSADAGTLGGNASTEFHLEQYGDGLSLEGRFKVNDGNFMGKDQTFSLQGIDATIPFYYQNKIFPGKNDGAHFSGRGFFSVDTLRLSSFFSHPLYLDITSAANVFQLHPVMLDIFGGRIVLGQTVISFAQGLSNISGSSSCTVENLDLSRIPLKSELFQFEGTAGANFPVVEIHPDHISTQGQGYIHAFDGNITIHDLGIQKPFTNNRTISCNIDFSGLNLEKLTNSTPYGRVTGIINGEIKNLAISYGQTESFALSLLSEKRKGIPQKFSTAAIQDLEILGTGGTSSMSTGKFLSRFISEFRYSKIGIFCSLKNDVFTLRGTIKERGTEYLVKNAWIFGISVINRKPQNQISFKDMLSRLKRIHQSQESR